MDIPNVKSAHVEKSLHPCQFPVELVDRFVIGLTDEGDTVLDPFAGVGSTIISAMKNKRHGIGFEMMEAYVSYTKSRIKNLLNGTLKLRSMYTVRYVPSPSDRWSIRPKEWDDIMNPSLQAEESHPVDGIHCGIIHTKNHIEYLHTLVNEDKKTDLIILRGNSTYDIDMVYKTLHSGGSLCTIIDHSKEGFSMKSQFISDTRFFLRNRIFCWHDGVATFSSILWFTTSDQNKTKKRSDSYYFDLDAVRIPSKYPGKRSAKTGQISGNPLGKNPSNIWHCEESCGSIGGFCICHISRIIRSLSPLDGNVLFHTVQPPTNDVLSTLEKLKRNIHILLDD
jgi:hypothetical protein